MVGPRDIVRIAGLSDAIVSGEAPVALVRMVERPDLARHVGEAGAASTELALHLRPGSITPVDDARAAGVLVARRAQEQIDAWNGVQPGMATADDRFPFHAALMARDGQWYVAALSPHVEGAIIPNHPHAAHALNNATDAVATRQDGALRMVSHGSAGFTFRNGSDEAAMRRAHELPQTVLGDGYQASIVDANVERSRAMMPALAASLDDMVPERRGWSLHQEVRVGSRGVLDFGHARYPVRNAIADATWELDRLLPDELTSAAADPALRARVAAMRADLATALVTIDEQLVTPAMIGAPVDVDALRSAVGTLQAQLDALPAAPTSTHGGQLPEFDAFIARLMSPNMMARQGSMRTFDYGLFGRNSGERMRNVGIALEAIHEGVGFNSLGGMLRLKAWLRSLAEDAAQVRRELPPEHARIAPLLDQVEEHARRNGADGVVVNAQGMAGYEDWPDFAEIGRMGAALRTYLAIDDATGRMAPALTEAIPQERLVW
ncbi:MAG: hypothetical protein JWL76_1517 [Thermoleophilia bacterium]|nr:hypothetical protein [Thermoleophilia bacterium]